MFRPRDSRPERLDEFQDGPGGLGLVVEQPHGVDQGPPAVRVLDACLDEEEELEAGPVMGTDGTPDAGRQQATQRGPVIVLDQWHVEEGVGEGELVPVRGR